jgi:type I restriction enzyme R subunit
LAALLQAIEQDEQRKREQTARGLDTLTFFVFTLLREKSISHSEQVSKKIGQAFAEYSNWRTSENELRELRKEVTFAILSQEDDLGKVTAIVDELFVTLHKEKRG